MLNPPMTSYRLAPVIVAKHFLQQILHMHEWTCDSVSNLLVWKTGEYIVVGSSSVWMKIREHICVIIVFFVCLLQQKHRETTTARSAWRRLGCDWPLLASTSIYDPNSTRASFSLSKQKRKQLFFIHPEKAPTFSRDDRTWWLAHALQY